MQNERKKPARHRPNAEEKRALAAETMRRFAGQYARKAQKGVEPNDRRYVRETEAKARRMPPEALDRLLNGDD